MKKSWLLGLISVLAAGFLFAGDVYVLDTTNSGVGFCTKHLVINTVCGRFGEFEATINFVGDDIASSSWTGTIKTASVNTGSDRRDSHLKSADFFDVEKYPEITFKSTKVEKKGDGYYTTGTLTMRGVSKEITFPFSVTGPITVFGKKRIGIEATLALNRQDYGVAWNQKLDMGGVVVSDEVKVTLNGEAVLKE